MQYTKTGAGQQAFKPRSPSISARQRSMFILFDGQKTAEQVLSATSGLGIMQADVQAMVDLGYLAPAEPVVQEVFAPAPDAAQPGRREPVLKGSVLRSLAGSAGVW